MMTVTINATTTVLRADTDVGVPALLLRFTAT